MERGNSNSVRSEKEPDLSEETFVAMEEFGLVLKLIFLRMQKDGYQMLNGKIVKPYQNEGEEKYRRKNTKGNQKR